MRNTSGFSLIAIFVSLALLHVYWATGGRSGRVAGVPSVDGRPLFNPSPLGTLAVAVALLIAALVVAGVLGWLPELAPPSLFQLPATGLSLVFLLRAIGDFKHVGFFQRSTGTLFSRWDLRLYSPLCLLIAVSAFLLAR